MAFITLSVLEGLERGRIYERLETPVTIGREEDNMVQLNDERVSRVHAKLQEDRGQIIMTDLNSTNGSRINGHPVQLRVLQPGDHLQIGRCTLLFGSDAEIADYARRIGVEVKSLSPLNGGSSEGNLESDSDLQLAEEQTPENLQLPLFPGGAPQLPEELQALQRARMSDVLAYIHERMRAVAFEAEETNQPRPDNFVEVPWQHWQNMLQLQRDLAAYLKSISNPE